MIENIIARRKECEILQESLESRTSQLIIVYGRRRVGKTFLINQFFDDNFSFKVTGVYDKPKDTQLEIFTKALNFYQKMGGIRQPEFDCDTEINHEMTHDIFLGFKGEK